MNRVYFVNVLWGQGFTNLFLRISLPSQLSPRNLQYCAQNVDAVYRVYTTAMDAEQLQTSSIWKELTNQIRTEVFYLDDVAGRHWASEPKHEVMTRCHRHLIRTAAGEDPAFVFLAPDTVWSEGTFERLITHLQDGKRMVLTCGLRTQKETFSKALMANFGKDGRLQPIPARCLVRLALDHLHAEIHSLAWGGDVSNLCTSIITWPVGKEGILLRAFHLHPILVRPHQRNVVPKSTIDGDYVLSAIPDLSDIHVVQDSDEMVVFELSGMYERAEGFQYCPLTVNRVAQWAKEGANSRHREIVKHSIRLHHDDWPASGEWAAAEAAAERVITSILSALQEAEELDKDGQASVSVVIRSTREDRLVSAAFESLAKGLRGNSEILVVSAASEGGLDLVQVGSSPDDRRSVRHLESSAELAEHVHGKFVLVTNSTDRLAEGFLEKAVQLLIANPAAGFCCSDAKRLRPNTSSWTPEDLYSATKTRYWHPKQLIELTHGGCFPDYSCVFRRSAWLEAEEVSPKLGIYRDWFMRALIAFRHGIVYLPEIQVTCGLPSDPESGAGLQEFVCLGEILKTLESPPYRDVLPFFAQSSALSHFGEDVARIASLQPGLWNAQTFMLIQEPLCQWQQSLARRSVSRRRQLDLKSATTLRRLSLQSLSQGKCLEASRLFLQLVSTMPKWSASWLAYHLNRKRQKFGRWLNRRRLST